MSALLVALPTRTQLRHAMRHSVARVSVIVAMLTTIVALTIGVVFTWWPAREANGLQRAIDSERQHRQQAQQRVALSAAYEVTHRVLPVLEHKLLQPLNQASAIEMLRAAAVKSGLRIGNATFGRLEADARYTALSHELNLTGSYASLKRFLAAVPELAIYTTVLDLRIEPGDRGWQIRATARLGTFGAPARLAGQGQP